MTIRFNRPGLAGNELAYIQDAVADGRTASSGPFSDRAAEFLRQAIGAEDVLLTTSCTDALEMAAMLLRLGPGDTVIVPSFTFTSTALAFARQGATIRFCDIERDTLGADPAHVRDLLDGSVKAVVPVHYAGIGCDLAGLSEALEEWPDVSIVEDNAHGLFGKYRDKPLGAFGRFSTLSFHETKNFICGEGGALVLNDRSDIERAHVLLDKGTNRRAFMLGDVDKYSWQDVGSSFGLSDLLAAFLLAQLEQHEEILAKRSWVADRYRELLEPHVERIGIELPKVMIDRESAHHMFYVLLPNIEVRNSVLASMKASDIHPTFHYVPLHSSPAGRRFSDRGHDCPVTTEISGRLLRLPFYTDLTEGEIERVVTALVRSVEAVLVSS